MINLLLLTLAVLGAWAGLVLIIPSLLRSISRHRFWRLRDDLADAVIRGEIDRSTRAIVLLERIEAVIGHAGWMSLWTLAFLPRPPQAWSRQERATDRERSVELSDHDRQKLDDFQQQLMWLVNKHLLFCSPLGWLLLAVLSPLVVVYRGWGGTKRKVGQLLEKTAAGRTQVMIDRFARQQKVALDACVS